jgi:hypothetical protein
VPELAADEDDVQTVAVAHGVQQELSDGGDAARRRECETVGTEAVANATISLSVKARELLDVKAGQGNATGAISTAPAP